MNTKLQVIVDGLGNPVEFLLSPGNDHDAVHAIERLKQAEISGSNVLADRAYGTAEPIGKVRSYASQKCCWQVKKSQEYFAYFKIF